MPDPVIHYGFSLLFLLSMRKEPKKSIFLAIAGVLPDFDVFLYPIIVHRTLTHSILVIWLLFSIIFCVGKYYKPIEKYKEELLYVPILMSLHVLFDLFEWYVAILWPINIAIWIEVSAISSIRSGKILGMNFNIHVADLSVFGKAGMGYIFGGYSPAFGIISFIIAFLSMINNKNVNTKMIVSKE